MYLNFPRYVTIANKTLESIQESLSTCPVAPINIMYLNRPRYFTIANNTSKKYGFPKEKQCFFMKSLFEVLSMLNFNLMPTWLHFASQNRPKIHENVDPKRLPIMHPFSLRFWTPKTSLLGSNLEPSWPSVSLQDGPSLPDPPRGLPDPTWSHLGSQSRLKTSQEASQTPQRPPRSSGGPFLVDFWLIFD